MKNVVFEDIPGNHIDNRRTLTTIFNTDISEFKVAAQVKVATMKKTAKLGGHYHRYAELFTVLSGKAMFKLTDRDSGESHAFEIVPGKRLIIPAEVFHEALVDKGTILLGLTEEPYISAEHNDLK